MSLIATLVIGSVLYVAVALIAYATGYSDGKQNR